MEATNTAPELSYAEQMTALRGRIIGSEYMKHIKKLLPDLTPWQIRHAVNGRTENPLVLSALEIVVHQMQKKQQANLDSLNAARKELDLAA